MGKRGRPEGAGTARLPEQYDPEKYPGLLEAMDSFRNQIDIILRANGCSNPRTVISQSVPGFSNEAMSAWRTNADRGDPLARIRLMIASLESQTPSRGADQDTDEAWAHPTVREKAQLLSGYLNQQIRGIVEHSSPSSIARPAASGPTNKSPVYSKDMLRTIADSIRVCSDNDPERPEYPPESPKFPATPTISIELKDRRLLLKDEGKNTTGTHKDRWAWEMIVRYKDWITSEALPGRSQSIHVPRYSMISSGSAAVALQTALRSHYLPDLHVLMDTRTPDVIENQLELIGARVFRHDLSASLLSPTQVCQYTQNRLGQDVTPRHAEDPFNERYYDWLCYEILNEKPKHIFVPFGTGGLFANIIFIINEVVCGSRDPRLSVACELPIITVYGATTEQPNSNMTMLYAPFRPTLGGIREAIDRFVENGSLGPRSGIFPVTDDQADTATALIRDFGSRADPSGAAALALYIAMADSLPPDDQVLVVNTGSIYLPRDYGDSALIPPFTASPHPNRSRSSA